MENERQHVEIIRRPRYFCTYGGIPLVVEQMGNLRTTPRIILTFNGSIARDAIFSDAYVTRVRT